MEKISETYKKYVKFIEDSQKITTIHELMKLIHEFILKVGGYRWGSIEHNAEKSIEDLGKDSVIKVLIFNPNDLTKEQYDIIMQILTARRV